MQLESELQDMVIIYFINNKKIEAIMKFNIIICKSEDGII